jgi:hypothetical protein
MLVFQTFVQQSLKIELREVEDTTAIADIPMALSRWGSGGEALYIGGFDTGTSQETEDHLLSPALKAGILTNRVELSDITGTCSTGQCSWEPYTTLAICTETEDKTSELISYSNRTSKVQYPTLPEVQNGFSERDNQTTFFVKTFKYSGNRTLLNYRPGPETPNNTDSNLPDLAHIYALYSDPCNPGVAETSEERNKVKNWKAYKARVRYCLQTLDSKTDNSSSTTKIVESKTDLQWKKEFKMPNSLDYQWCTRHGKENEKYCISESEMMYMGNQFFRRVSGFSALTRFSLTQYSSTIQLH